MYTLNHNRLYSKVMASSRKKNKLPPELRAACQSFLQQASTARGVIRAESEEEHETDTTRSIRVRVLHGQMRTVRTPITPAVSERIQAIEAQANRVLRSFVKEGYVEADDFPQADARVIRRELERAIATSDPKAAALVAPSLDYFNRLEAILEMMRPYLKS
jgi:hypothetical protein